MAFNGMTVYYDQNLVKWQRDHPGDILLKKDFVCLLPKAWDTYLTLSLIEKSIKSTGMFDPSVPMRVNPSVTHHSKFEPAKLRPYAEKKRNKRKKATSKVTTIVNT